MSSYYSYREPQQKRYKSDAVNNFETNPPAVAASSASLVQDELADKHKLANAKEFHIQGNPNGQILACGMMVYTFPEYYFRIRIYDRDRHSAGKLRNYIELGLDKFLRIKCQENRILHSLHHFSRQKEIIFRDHNFYIAIVPGHRPLIEFCDGCYICLDKDTFINMMSYEDTLRNEDAECTKLYESDKQFLNEMVNMMAFNRNEGRTNEFVNEPAEWYQAGTVTTWKKFETQVAKSKDRLQKKTSNNVSR